jgi:HEXXH motif-containing protein
MGDMDDADRDEYAAPLSMAGALLDELWPEFWMDGLVGEIWPMMPLPRRETYGRGCMCGHSVPPRCQYTAIHLTVFDWLGTVEAIVHETAHVKLHAFGMGLEEHNGSIIENDPCELFESPVRKDKKRPMSACIQAQYSYAYVTHINLLMHDHDIPNYSLERLSNCASKVREGIDTIAGGATPSGPWLFALLDWCQEMVDESEQRLCAA